MSSFSLFRELESSCSRTEEVQVVGWLTAIGDMSQTNLFGLDVGIGLLNISLAGFSVASSPKESLLDEFPSRNRRLRKSFSTVTMLSTNLCRFSICFLHNRQQNGNVRRGEILFVEFDGRKSNKCSRYYGIFRSSSVMLVLTSVLTKYLSPFSAPLLQRMQVSSWS